MKLSLKLRLNLPTTIEVARAIVGTNCHSIASIFHTVRRAEAAVIVVTLTPTSGHRLTGQQIYKI